MSDSKSRLILGLRKDIPCFLGNDISITYIENRGAQQVGIMIEAPRGLEIRRADAGVKTETKKTRYIAGRKNEA